jgi:pimeloyl-ACP methyl ester carboxylesterase
MEFLHSAKVAKFITAASAVLLMLAGALLLVTGFSLNGILSTDSGAGGLDTQTILGGTDIVPISGPGIAARDAVFFPGKAGGPTIILAHGLRMRSSSLLTLVAAFQDNGYNVLVFDFRGHGGVKGRTTFGYKETSEVLAAIEAVMLRDDIDRERIGIWGHDMGAYAGLAAAAVDGRVRAVVVDSAFDSPEAKLQLELRNSPGDLPLIRTLCRWGFRLLNFPDRKTPPLSARVPAMGGVAKLFIQGRDRPDAAEATLQLFLKAAEPRQQMVVNRSDFSTMSDEEKNDYQKQVVTFFLQNLPPAMTPPKPPR